MALQIIPQPNQPVGLQLLGNAIERGAAGYSARLEQDRLRALALEDEARRRSERRADVESDRSYQRGELDRIRNLQLGDEQRRRGESIEDAKTRAALEARLRALGQAASLGLFDMQQIGDMQAESAALAALQQRVAEDSSFANQQPANAQARLQELVAAEQDITGKMAAVEARLSAQPTVDETQVANMATQIATQANGGKIPSREQIQQALPEAYAKAQQDAQIRWWQDKNDAQLQYQLLSSQLNTIRQQQANLTSTFKVAPTASLSSGAPVGATSAPTPASSGGNPLAGFIDALNTRVPPPAPVASPESRSIQSTTTALQTAPAGAAPILRQSRTAMLADEYAKLDAPVATTEAKLADTQRKLQLLQSGLTPWQGVDQSPINIPVEAQGQMLTELLQSEAALQRQLAEDRAARQSGKTSLLQGVGSNTASGFKPYVPPSPGALLSPR